MNPAIINWLEDQWYRILDFWDEVYDWNGRLDEIPFLITVLVVVVGIAFAIVMFGSMCYNPGEHPFAR